MTTSIGIQVHGVVRGNAGCCAVGASAIERTKSIVNCHVVFLYAADRGEQGCNQTPVVVSAGSEIVLCDGGGGREIVIAKEGFDDIVVWNPWVDKAKKFVDFGDEEYNSMLCIEPANAAKYVAGETVAVTAGETWTASQSVYVRQL